MKKIKHDPETSNREEWLQKAATAMRPWFEEIDRKVPPVRISVGWPKRVGKEAVGQCWSGSSAEDGVAQIFVTPGRGDKQTVAVLGTLLHELVHAVDDCQHGHAGEFIKIARALGFTAKWTSSENRGDELTERLKGLAERLGPFPSAALSDEALAASKQSTRMLKVVCAHSDPDDRLGYKVRMSRTQIDEVGLPICPCHHETMEEV